MNCQFFLLAILSIISVATIHAKSLSQNENAIRAVSSEVNEFAASYYKTLTEGRSGNVVTSPLSLALVLNMLKYGAHGTTEEKLRSLLHLPTDDRLAKNGLQSLIDSLKGSKEAELHLANKIFTQNDFTLKQEFQDLTQNVFRSAVQSLDFSDSTNAANTINDWVQKNTNNKIKELVKADGLKDSLAVLTNAVYFKGKWKQSFNSSLTRPRIFHIDEQTTKKVDIMVRKGNFNYGKLPDIRATYVELPYKNEENGPQLSMFVFVPWKINGFRDVESNVHKLKFSELNQYKEEINVFLPKFTIESDLDLEETLKKLGLENIFGEFADFSGIGSGALSISKVVQKAYISVNEEGSEAAAATGSEIIDLILPTVVVADKPFVAVIVEKNSDAILFSATIKDPSITVA